MVGRGKVPGVQALQGGADIRGHRYGEGRQEGEDANWGTRHQGTCAEGRQAGEGASSGEAGGAGYRHCGRGRFRASRQWAEQVAGEASGGGVGGNDRRQTI